MLPVLTHILSSPCASQVAMETASSSDKEAATTTAAATKTSNTIDFSLLDLSSAAQAPDGR